MLRASRAMLWVVMMMVVLVVRAVAGQSDDALPPVPKDPSDPPAPAPAAAAPEECFSAGSVAGAVVGTFAATLILLAAAALLYKFYWRGRRGKHLILTKDPEGGADQFAFDNPCFRDGSPLARSPPEKDPNRIDQKAKWSGWPSLAALAGGTKATGEKRRALDDSCIASGTSFQILLCASPHRAECMTRCAHLQIMSSRSTHEHGKSILGRDAMGSAFLPGCCRNHSRAATSRNFRSSPTTCQPEG